MDKNKAQNLSNFGKKPTKKFVKKAGQWCKTSWINGKQVQEWSNEEPKLLQRK